MITNTELFEFNWPPKFTYPFKRGSKYIWVASIYPKIRINDKEIDKPLFTLRFHTKRQAEGWRRETIRSVNEPQVVIDKIKLADEDGFIR